MIKKINIFVAIILTFLLAFPPAVMANVVGTVTCIEGRVDKCAKGGDKYLPLVIGEKISTGDSVRTKSSSKAEITFSDNSVIRLAESTQARVTDYVIGEDGYRDSAVIDLDRGKMRAVVAKTLDMAPFGINTPNAAGVVKGSDVFVGFQQSATSVLVAEGVFNMVNSSFPADAKNIGAGMTSYVPYNEPPADPREFLPEEKEKLESVTGPVVYNMEGVSSTAVFTKAVVAKTFGTVRVLPKGTNNWHVPVKDEVLNTGDQIETGESGNILIAFDNGLSLELKPNTQLIITKLTRDPQSGNYDNVFESKYGKLVAKLQNKPEGSTFQVKTPHACCGIRGTIMYLDIQPGATKSFFEGGSGYVQDLADGNLNVIQEGKTAAVGSEGGITESETTEEDRSNFGSEFGNESDEEYGYSDGGDSGDNGSGSGDDSGDSGSGSGSNSDGSDGSGDGDLGSDTGGDLFSEVVEELPEDTVTEEEPFTPTVALTGEGVFGHYNPADGSLVADYSYLVTADGFLVADPDSWFLTDLFGAEKNSAMAPDLVECSGTYYNPYSSYLFSGGLSGTGDDGAAYYGRMVGARDPDDQTFGAVIAAIYVEPSLVDGDPVTGGIMFGGIGGYIVPDGTESASGAFYGTGAVTYLLSPDKLSGILSEDLANLADIVVLDGSASGSMYAAESGDGNYLSGSFGMNFFNIGENADRKIERQPWGIWEGGFSADYYRDGGVKNWSGKFGATDGEGYFIGNLNVLDDGGSFGSASLAASYMGYYSMGTIFGDILGTYENDGTYAYFEGVGAGVWTDQPLSHVSEIGEGIIDLDGNSYYMDYNGDVMGGSESYDASYLYDRFSGVTADEPGTDGPMWGLLGGVGSFWSASSGVTLVGQFDHYGESDSFVWASSIASWNYNDESYTTYDGGAYYGYVVGVTKGGATSGFVSAIGISPDGVAAGYVSGELTGEFYRMPTEEGIDGMFVATGDLTFTEMDLPAPMAPGGLYSNLANTSNGESMMAGEGVVIDYLDGNVDSIHVASMYGVGVGISDAGWGAWVAAMNGSFRGGITPGTAWDVPVAGLIIKGNKYDPDISDSYYMIRANFNEWSSEDIMPGKVEGIWISTHGSDDSGLSLGKINGKVVASGTGEFVDGGEEFVGSWEGAGAGEWVEVGELLDLVDFTKEELQDMTGFDFISIPITETLAATGMTGQITSASMDIAVFAQDNAMSGVWAALISGTYNPALVDPAAPANWSINLTSTTTPTVVDVTGVTWADNQWTAKVAGNMDDKILAGTAAGTYNTDGTSGTFSGAGAGVWMDKQAAKDIDPTPPITGGGTS